MIIKTVEAECWATPWGINNPNSVLRIQKGYTSCLTARASQRLYHWVMASGMRLTRSQQCRAFIVPNISQIIPQANGDTCWERSQYWIYKGNEYPSKLSCQNKINKTDRMAVGILHLYCILWFISRPRDMEKANMCLFWIMMAHFCGTKLHY